ncbi:hypothetical protein SDC9_95152 [bioreactor metagenome]|uniref:Uncharacterized protein n=1 Tax=bioreactor metagenome TaxID=1076179 RepID=A0A645A5Q8_9ZZZZ
MLGSFAEFERAVINERTRNGGIAIFYPETMPRFYLGIILFLNICLIYLNKIFKTKSLLRIYLQI